MRKKPFLKTFILFSSSIISISALAQLDTVLVTAQKKTELLQKVPLAVSTFNSKQINAYRIWNIKDISGIIPNVYSADPGDGRDVTAIRGIATTSYDPSTAVYIDGVNQFNLDTYIPNLFDVERIEILRGPQGSLYGRNAMGGVINIITKQPTNNTSGSAELNWGNYGQKRMNLNIKTPIIKDKLFVGASGLFDAREGFYQNEYNQLPYDRQRAISGNYFLKYIINKQWSITFNTKHRNQENKGAFPLVFGVEEAFNNPFVLNQNATTIMKDKTLNSSMSILYNGTKYQFSAQTAYQKNYRYYTNPIDGDFSPIDAITVVNNYGKEWNQISAWTQDLKLNSIGNQPLKWTIGAYLFSQNAPTKQGTHFGADAYLMGIENSNFSLINTTNSKRKGIALYGQATYALSEKLNLTAGIRNDFEQIEQSVNGSLMMDENKAIYETQALISRTTDFGALSPKLGLDYTISPTQMAFVNYSKGFRAGGLSPLSSDPSQPPLMRYKPEYSNNIELGLKNTLFNNHARLNLTVFYTSLVDAQVPTLILPDAITIIQNRGKLNSKGIELEFTAQANAHLSIDYNAGMTNAKFETLEIAQNGNANILNGNKQIFTPDLVSNLALQYDQKFNKDLSGFVRTEWRYIGTTYFDLANSIQQSPYNIINASLGVQMGDVQIKFWTRNLTNQKYISYAYDFGAVHLGDPATSGLSITIKF
ncbi:MAG: TonB-dependent receptor [Sediminibacterium sp.]